MKIRVRTNLFWWFLGFAHRYLSVRTRYYESDYPKLRALEVVFDHIGQLENLGHGSSAVLDRLVEVIKSRCEDELELHRLQQILHVSVHGHEEEEYLVSVENRIHELEQNLAIASNPI
jgi:hypothetical protein